MRLVHAERGAVRGSGRPRAGRRGGRSLYSKHLDLVIGNNYIYLVKRNKLNSLQCTNKRLGLLMPNTFSITTAQQLTQYVRALRKTHGYTQADLGRKLGVSAMRVATIEKDVGRLSTKSLIALLQLLDAKLDLVVDSDATAPADRELPAARHVSESSPEYVKGRAPRSSGSW